jgi:hypothetical protein
MGDGWGLFWPAKFATRKFFKFYSNRFEWTVRQLDQGFTSNSASKNLLLQGLWVRSIAKTTNDGRAARSTERRIACRS